MFGSIGVAEFIVLAILVVPVLAVIFVWRLLRNQKDVARRLGYPSLTAYLRAAPQTDEEKRAAVDLALKGLVICLLGLLMPPVLLIGLIPLFYGVRKIAYASMGLGLVDDARK